MEVYNYSVDTEYFKKHFEHYENSNFFIKEGRVYFINAFPYKVKKFKLYCDDNGKYTIHVDSGKMFIKKEGDEAYTLEMSEPLVLDNYIIDILRRKEQQVLVINALEEDNEIREKNIYQIEI